ncbi:acyl CoA binding protein-domain-containing protein [Mucor mucedo]|uniref:acyl CoA binding protein-domain-containing protein n=1 Tax=Mucor mucedo TaxID=29922 RepID=UPI002220AD28|nr:acyl CoA binding protein-domain-containing protein [Mucor mucedo]KAI7891541.1 acyl CoA binding protein-domain-containing protein [Mucor mucedo]
MSSSASLYMTQVRFCRALAVVRCLPTESGGAFQPSIADRLNFYGLYKQTLAGDCMLLKPSSKHIVQYAKWKAWDRLRGVSPIDAQIMYIHALIDLLTEFLEKYPDSELTVSLTESLDYLQEVQDTGTDQEENLVQWDTNEQEKEEYYLGSIRSEQLLSEQQGSYYSSPSEFPMTPELSPRYYQQEEQEYDNEVATATSSLYLSTPSRHPYAESSKKSSKLATKKALKNLQIEVAALCQEIDHLRREKHHSYLRWRGLWLLKSVARHTFFNFLIMILVFVVLWRRKSPIAYAIMSYTGPRTRDQIRYLFRHFVFWKVTA